MYCNPKEIIKEYKVAYTTGGEAIGESQLTRYLRVNKEMSWINPERNLSAKENEISKYLHGYKIFLDIGLIKSFVAIQRKHVTIIARDRELGTSAKDISLFSCCYVLKILRNLFVFDTIYHYNSRLNKHSAASNTHNLLLLTPQKIT